MKNWQDKIRRDLLPFANPGTVLDCAESGRWFEVNWKSRSNTLRASFALDENQDVMVRFNDNEMTYNSFLASSQISDMLGIASMILQNHKESIYVETKAKSPDVNEWSNSATVLIRKIVTDLSPGVTNIIFVNADAGAGKTEVLKQLVLDQANRYMMGQAEFLYLYVNAQGRALARLEEALATEIQDLRASNLTYHVVPSLTRNGILVPLIDGFDELLGVLGYEDSFSSLRRFLNELDGEGCVIASARSTYYQQEFLSRASKATFGLKGITINQVDILPWSNDEFIDFVEKKFNGARMPKVNFEAFKKGMVDAFASDNNKILRSKPFFVAAAANLILEGVDLRDKELIDQLVHGYIERERKDKLLDRSGRSLLTNQQIKNFLQAVSDEMWISETRSLDQETIKTLADLVFDVDKIDGDAARILQERASTMAFFTASSHLNRIEFEHQLFFSYFLGDTIAAAFCHSQLSVYSLFARASLPEGSASFTARRLAAKSRSPEAVVTECGRIFHQGSLRPPHLKENAGSIVAEFLKITGELTKDNHFSNLDFRDIVFAGTDFSNISISDSSFSHTEFKRVDATNLSLRRCTAVNVTIQDLLIDPLHTKLDIKGIEPDTDIYGIRVREDGQINQLFRLDKVRSALEGCGFPQIGLSEIVRVKEDILALTERVLRKFDRSNVFWPTDEVNKQIINDPNWDAFSEMLVASGLIKKERTTAQKGPPKYYLRNMYSSEQIMSGQVYGNNTPDSVQKFWHALGERWPA